MSPGAGALRGRALVTGGTSGIGLAFARALAARGCDLVLVARDAERLAATAEELRRRDGIEVETLPADLTRKEDLERVAARLARTDSPVEVLVNNAGSAVRSPLLAEDTSEHERAVDLMVRAVLVLGGAAGRAMRARGHGVLVTVSSIAALLPQGSYSAIKSWALTYSDSLSLELAGTGVQVTALLPGWVRTEFHERAGIRTTSIPRGLWLDADRVVAECLRDVEKGRARSVPTTRYSTIAWLARHAPRPAVRSAAAVVLRSRR